LADKFEKLSSNAGKKEICESFIRLERDLKLYEENIKENCVFNTKVKIISKILFTSNKVNKK